MQVNVSVAFSPVPVWAVPAPVLKLRPFIADIQREVARHYQIPLIEMTSARRSWKVSRPRQVAMYLAKQLTLRSLPEIGRRFGNRDHTTVIHAVRATEARRREDPDLDNDIRILTAVLAPAAAEQSKAQGEI